jgi:hypothetical protein
VETGEPDDGLVAVEVVEVTTPLLVEPFPRQESEQGTEGGNPLRAGIARLGDEAVEAEPGQQEHEEKEARDSRRERVAGREAPFSAVGDFGWAPASLAVRKPLDLLRTPARSRAGPGHRGGTNSPQPGSHNHRNRNVR